MRRLKTIVAALLVSSAFYAQTAGATEDFKGYWNMHLRGGIAHTVGETAYKNLLSPTASVGVGYRITPVWGVRADINGWQGKGATVVPRALYSFNFIQGNVDATVDICSIFAGFKSARVWNPYVLAGVGVNGRFGNDEAAEIKDILDPEYYWEGSKVSPTGRLGLGLDIRLCDALDLNIETNTSFLTDKFNSKPGSIVDFQNNILLGLKFNFGKPKASDASNSSSASDAVATAAAATAASAAALAATEQKPVTEPAGNADKAKNSAKAAKVDEAAKEAKVEEQERAGVQTNVFFTIGKWNIVQSEAQKLDEVIAYMKDNKDAKVTITGYADKDTGSAGRNMYLSEQRANAVRAMLVNAGIDGDRISTVFKGCTENPFKTPAENRVAVCVAK